MSVSHFIRPDILLESLSISINRPYRKERSLKNDPGGHRAIVFEVASPPKSARNTVEEREWGVKAMELIAYIVFGSDSMYPRLYSMYRFWSESTVFAFFSVFSVYSF